MGIVDRLVATGSDRDAARALAGEIAAHAPLAVRQAKAALRGGLGLGLDEALEVEDAAWRTAAASEDRAEGIVAFVEKRAPRWTGR